MIELEKKTHEILIKALKSSIDEINTTISYNIQTRDGLETEYNRLTEELDDLETSLAYHKSEVDFLEDKDGKEST